MSRIKIITKNLTLNLYSKLILFLQAQLFVSSIATPILVHWGLPTSIMSFLGNLLFFPFLAMFLFISSIVFFSELLHIPNNCIVCILEIIVKLWKGIFSYNSTSWLVCFSLKSLPIFWAGALASIIVLYHPKTRQTKISTIILLIIFVTTNFIGKILTQPKNTIFKVQYKKNSATVIKNKNQTIVVDPGILGTARSTQWIEYTFIPELIKQTGSLKINKLIIMKNQKNIFQDVTSLLQKCKIDKIYMPESSKNSDTETLPNTIFISQKILKTLLEKYYKKD